MFSGSALPTDSHVCWCFFSIDEHLDCETSTDHWTLWILIHLFLDWTARHASHDAIILLVTTTLRRKPYTCLLWTFWHTWLLTGKQWIYSWKANKPNSIFPMQTCWCICGSTIRYLLLFIAFVPSGRECSEMSPREMMDCMNALRPFTEVIYYYISARKSAAVRKSQAIKSQTTKHSHFAISFHRW